MMTIEQVTQFIRESAVKFGHPELKYLPVEVNTRLRTCLGRCHCRVLTGEVSKIQMSKKLLNEAPDEDIIQVALHELAHAIVCKEHKGEELRPHGSEFKAVCRRIGCTHLGATNEITFNPRFAADDYSYVVECPECGHQWFYKTNCKTVQRAGEYHCSTCKVNLVSRRLVK